MASKEARDRWRANNPEKARLSRKASRYRLSLTLYSAIEYLNRNNVDAPQFTRVWL